MSGRVRPLVGLTMLSLLVAAPGVAQEPGAPEAPSSERRTAPLPPERPGDLQPVPRPPRAPADRATEEPDASAEDDPSDDPGVAEEAAPRPPRPPSDRGIPEDADPTENLADDIPTGGEPPAPPPRPALDEPEAVLPDEPPAPLEITPAEREAHAACLADIERLGVMFEETQPVEGENGCGIGLPVRVTALAGGAIVLEPAITVTCAVARGLARWNAQAVVPAAREHLDATVETFHVAGSFVCRGRNRDPNARLSEHGLGNAVDISGIAFVEGDEEAWSVAPRDGRTTPRARFQREIRRAACAHFTTVLGPGSDGYHDDHLHLDQRERTNGYRLCR